MAGPYIVDGDITDMVILDFPSATRAAKITLSTDAVERMALRKGIDSDDIETDTVAQVVQDWAVSWVGKELCFDATGKNNISIIDQEKYRYKYDLYTKRLKELEQDITPADLLGEDTDEQRHLANNMIATVYRSG